MSNRTRIFGDHITRFNYICIRIIITAVLMSIITTCLRDCIWEANFGEAICRIIDGFFLCVCRNRACLINQYNTYMYIRTYTRLVEEPRRRGRFAAKYACAPYFPSRLYKEVQRVGELEFRTRSLYSEHAVCLQSSRCRLRKRID